MFSRNREKESGEYTIWKLKYVKRLQNKEKKINTNVKRTSIRGKNDEIEQGETRETKAE